MTNHPKKLHWSSVYKIGLPNFHTRTLTENLLRNTLLKKFYVFFTADIQWLALQNILPEESKNLNMLP